MGRWARPNQFVRIAVRKLPAEAFSMIGKTISHYRIIDRLCQGGMGEIFVAEDKNVGQVGMGPIRAHE
jgi:hypothetical protein